MRLKYKPPEGYKSASQHKLFEIYLSMLCRCEDPDDKYYYGRVKVCDRWKGEEGFVNWLNDMGPRPEGKSRGGRALYSIERKDNDGDYEPNNCCWATKSEQNKNVRRIAPNGTIGTIWITDGKEFRRVKPDCIPEGFVKGTAAGFGSYIRTEEHRKVARENKLGKQAWNKGLPMLPEVKEALNSPKAVAKRWITRRLLNT